MTNIITTGELNGVSNGEISKMIEDVLSENFKGGGEAFRYSKYHYYLNKK